MFLRKPFISAFYIISRKACRAAGGAAPPLHGTWSFATLPLTSPFRGRLLRMAMCIPTSLHQSLFPFVRLDWCNRAPTALRLAQQVVVRQLATRQLATAPTFGDVESLRARDASLQAVRTRLRFSVRRMWEPMLVQAPRRTLYGWDNALPYLTLRVGLNEPFELEHISMTALARSAQWTGVFAFIFDALLLGGRLTILTGSDGACVQSRGACP